MGKRVAVIIRDQERQYEGLRYSLGLLLGQHIVSLFVINHELKVPEEYLENMDLLDELGGCRYSNVSTNVDNYGFQSIRLEKIALKLKENEFVFPF